MTSTLLLTLDIIYLNPFMPEDGTLVRAVGHLGVSAKSVIIFVDKRKAYTLFEVYKFTLPDGVE